MNSKEVKKGFRFWYVFALLMGIGIGIQATLIWQNSHKETPAVYSDSIGIEEGDHTVIIGDSAWFYKGTIGWFYIYNYVMTDEEIEQIIDGIRN